MKKILKFIADEFVYGAHLVALGAVGIVISISLILKLTLSTHLLLISYLTFLIIYTYNHSRELSFDIKSNPERTYHLSIRKRWVLFSPFLYIIVLIYSVSLASESLRILIFGMVIAGILYTEIFKAVPILGFKSYYTSAVWSMLVIVIAFFHQAIDFTPYIYIAIFIFTRGIVNTVFFDIKDISSDSLRRLKTFPVYLGKEKTLLFLHFVNILSIIPLLVGIYVVYALPADSLLLAVTILLGIFYLYQARHLNEKRLRYVSYFLIDGEYIIWPLVIFIAQLII